MKTKPRGLRNNNPGNIRINSDNFHGEVKPSQDKAFKQFRTMAYGYRAVFRTLLTYHQKHGLKTIRAWITRWAPPIENNTESYIRNVSNAAKLSPDAEIDFNNKELMCRIVAEISRVENGVIANMADVEQGYNLL